MENEKNNFKNLDSSTHIEKKSQMDDYDLLIVYHFERLIFFFKLGFLVMLYLSKKHLGSLTRNNSFFI
jgi:hypothetical protein